MGIFLLVFMVYWYVMSRRLRRKNEELTVAHELAQESSRMKTKFIQNMSHEIRTPLNILSGFSQILAHTDMELSPEMKREATEKIMENTDRITTLINQLLALSESDSRTMIDRPDTLPCNQLCLLAVSRSRIEGNRSISFEFSAQLSDEEAITTNTEYAVQSLCRLLDNAQQFTPEGGFVRLSCQRCDGQLCIAIEDTGKGIPASEAEHVFEPFVQLDEFHQGVGVGLSVGRNVVRRLGGDIMLDTSYTNGARFLVTLPM